MQKDHGDSEHLSDLAGSTGHPGILPSDTRIVIDIIYGFACCSTGSGVTRSLTWVLKHDELR